MRRPTVGAVLLIGMLVGPGAVHRVSAQPSVASKAAGIDPRLRADVDRALSHHTEGHRDPLISVEVLTSDTLAVDREVNQLGGTVSGSVSGQLVQAWMPAGSVDALSVAGGARYMQRPVRVNRLPPTQAVGTGSVVGD